MKKIITGILLLSILSFAAHAQVQRSTIDSNRKGLAKKGANESIEDRMKLTISQKEAMRSINEGYKAKLQAIIRNESLTPEQRRSQRSILTSEKNNKILSLLTPEQKKIYTEFRQPSGSVNNPNTQKMQGYLDEIRLSLGLSDDQVAKITASHAAFQQKERDIYNNKALSADEKDSQLISLKKEKEQSFRGFLTANQAAKLDALRGNGDWKEKNKENGYKEKIKIKNS